MNSAELMAHILKILSDWFSPSSLPITTGVISLLVAGLSFVVAAITMFIALFSAKITDATYKVSIKAYTQVEREEPWKLTKLHENYWLLERIHPTWATIHGHHVYPATAEYVSEIPGSPRSFFVRGTKTVLQINEAPVGKIFTLFYTEYSDRTSAIMGQRYIGDMTHLHARNEIKNLKEWETVLY